MKRIAKTTGKIILGLLLLALLVQLWMLHGSHSKPLTSQTASSQIQRSTTPTLLIPGWGGGTWTYDKLIRTYQTQHQAGKVMTIWVFPNGKCLISGHLNRHQVNPLIQLLYVWNYSPTYQPQTRQLATVLTMLHEHYHVNKLNIIAHSYGGTEWANAVLTSVKQQRAIRYQKVVLLGVPVDESFGTKTHFAERLLGKSTDVNFKKLVRGASQMKVRHNQPAVYNLMGSKKGKHTRTDGSVPHIQSEMMRILVKRAACRYHEHVYANTSHSQLHQRKQIIKDVGQILWQH